MKNHRTCWEYLKYRSKQFKKFNKRIVTTSLVAGALLTPWNAAHAHEVYADFNGDGYMGLAIGIPYRNVRGLNHSTYPGTATAAGAVQIMYGMSMYGLQTTAYAPTLLHQYAPDYVNEYEQGFAFDDDGFLVVLSW